MAQLSKFFPNAQDFELDGELARRVPPTEEHGVIKEVVLATADFEERWFRCRARDRRRDEKRG